MPARPRPALLLLLAVLIGSLAAACGGDDDDGGVTVPPSADGSTSGPTAIDDDGRGGGPEPSLSGPASRYAPLLDDVGPGYFTELRQTFVLTVENFSGASLFGDADEGALLLTQWGYQGGFETGYEPERSEIDVLNGKFYSSAEVHLFEGHGGAQAFYEHTARRLSEAGSSAVSSAPLANESSGWFAFDDAAVPGSDIQAVFHWYLFRRGNMVAFVRTWGAQPFMTIDRAREVAITIDEKALGTRPAIEPTPIVFATPVAEGG